MIRKEFSLFSQKIMRYLIQLLETLYHLGIDFYDAKFISLAPLQNKLKFENLNFLFITFISVRPGKGNKQRMRLFPISECFSNKCS